MRALPLWQPWASLVALGAKQVETRAYPPERVGLRRGERIAIHACATRHEVRVCSEPFFRDYVSDAGALPFGCLVATCVLDRAREMTEESIRVVWSRHPHEFAFGVYRPGRWAWVLRDVHELARPVPWRGTQGTFNVPDMIELDAGVRVG